MDIIKSASIDGRFSNGVQQLSQVNWMLDEPHRFRMHNFFWFNLIVSSDWMSVKFELVKSHLGMACMLVTWLWVKLLMVHDKSSQGCPSPTINIRGLNLSAKALKRPPFTFAQAMPRLAHSLKRIKSIHIRSKCASDDKYSFHFGLETDNGMSSLRNYGKTSFNKGLSNIWEVNNTRWRCE